MAGIALFGVIGYRAMPVSDLPTVDYPTINVNASLPGADPSTMSSAVASVLERQFTGIAGLDSMTSRSSTGSTNVSLQFSLDRDIEGAATDVQSAIAAVTPRLPAPPSFHKQNPSDQPIIFLSLYSDTLPMSTIDEFAETQVAPRIAMINGVSQVQVMGQQKYAVRVQLDPDALAALYGPKMEYNIYANGQLYNAAQFRKLTIAYQNGRPVHLEDVARVIDSVQDDKQAAWVYTRDEKTNKLPANRAVTLMVMRQPGTNTVEVTDRVRALIPLFRQQLPPALTLMVRGDRSVSIRRAFDDIEITMLITLVLVVGVIFFFLR